MHMMDALVSPAVALTMYGCSSMLTMRSVKVLHQDQHNQIPVMGVMGSFIFAAQMINFAIPGTGSSGHLSGGLLLAAILGPQAAFLTMTGVLLIQSLLFADGGLMALGCNIWNIAFYGCILAYYMIWRPLTTNGLTKQKIFLVSLLSGVVILQLGAASVGLQTYLSGVTKLPYLTLLLTLQPIHLVIGLMEGLITGSILWFIYQMRPELFYQPNKTALNINKQSGKLLPSLMGISLLLIGGSTLLSSNLPDGLEWSLLKLEQIAPITAITSNWHQWLGDIQTQLSVYSTNHSSVLGILVALVALVGCLIGGSIYQRIKGTDE